MQGCGLRGRKEWRQSQSEEEVLELEFDERQRERPQRLSSWAVPSSALGFRKLSGCGDRLAWEPGDQR